jgi:hypothetical protein
LIRFILVVRRLENRVTRNIVGITATSESRVFHTTIDVLLDFSINFGAGAEPSKVLFYFAFALSFIALL